jgi:hypothetical protein
MASNRRTAFRLPTVFPVSVRRAGAPCLTTVTEDLSAGGLCFRAPEAFAGGTSVELSFTIDHTPVSVGGIVAHVAADTFGAAIGVAFTDVDGATTSRLVRFITACERARLPSVPIMYSLQCHVDRERVDLEGATEECSPGFVRLLLSRSITPGEPVTVVVKVGRTEMKLTGRVVTCRRADQLWRTQVELSELTGPITQPWRELVVRLRDASR